MLERLPGAVELVVVADGRALADPGLRPLIDALRPGLPDRFGCVLDAALASEVVGLTSDHSTGVTLVIAGQATPHHCGALSEIAPGLWSATIGAGAPVATRETSVAADPRWQRARSYLETAPIALAASSDGRDLIGALRPAPFSAWLTIDARDADQVELAARTAVAGMPSTHIDRKGGQVTVSVDASDRETVMKALQQVAVRRVWRAFDSAPARVASDDEFRCPSDDPDIVSCNGQLVTVRTLRAVIMDLAAKASAPVVDGGDVIGLRLVSNGPIGLRRGDVVMALGATRVANRADFAMPGAARAITLTVRRGARDLILDLVQE